jgi:hypothetical protein
MVHDTIIFHNTEEKIINDRKELCSSVIKEKKNFNNLYSISDNTPILYSRKSLGKIVLIDNR